MRIPLYAKAKYRPIGTEGVCYHCDSPGAKMTDTTPNYKASEKDKADFSGEWTINYICTKCWGKVHRANILMEGSGAIHGVQMGCMTLQQKTDHCGGRPVTMIGSNGFVLGFQGKWVVPEGIGQSPDNPTIFYHRSGTWNESELMALQGPMALRAVSADSSTVRNCFLDCVSYDDLTKADVLRDMPKYLATLRIEL